MTGREVIEYCNSHSCTKEDCEYMRKYCHIEENLDEECVYCETENCSKCKK